MPINVGQAVGYFDLNTDKFTKGLKSAWKELEVFEKKNATAMQKVQASGKFLSGVGSTLTKNVTLPIAAAATASLKASMDFESAFAGIRKTVDATEQEFSQLRKGILAMSEEMPQSASELAALGEIAGQLGIETENILSFTKTVAMLGDTTNLASEEAASSLARIANITGMSQDNFDRLGSSIVALGNNFATTEEEITNMALNLSSVGDLAGLSESEIVGLAAALSSVGLQAELGGTAMSKLLIKMQLATEQGGIELQNFATVANMSMDEFTKAFQEDAVTALAAWLSGLQDVDRLGSSTIKILNDIGISEVRLRDSTARLSNAGNLLNRAIETSNEAWEQNTALVDEANKRYETTESQLKILWNRFVKLGIKIGDVLLPTFNKLIDMLENVVNWLSNVDEGVLQFIVTTTAIIGVVGPVLTIFGKLITTIVKVVKWVKDSATAMKILTTVIGAVTSPVGMLVTVVAGLTAGLIALGVASSKGSKELQELNKSVKNANDTYEDSKEKIEEHKEALISDGIQAKNLIDRMYELSEQEMDTATKVSILTKMQEELKELIPNINIEIDKQTGKITTQKNELVKLANAWIDTAVAELYAKKQEDAAERITKAVENQIQAQEDYEKTAQKILEREAKISELELKRENASIQTKKIYTYMIEEQERAIKSLEKEEEKFLKIHADEQTTIEGLVDEMAGLNNEQEEFKKKVAEATGIQLQSNEAKEEAIEDTEELTAVEKYANEQRKKGRDDLADASIKYNKIITQSDLDAVEEQQKAKEEAFEAEKNRYDKLNDVTQKYYDDLEKIQEEALEKEKEIYAEEEELIAEASEEYNKALESRKEAIRGQFGLFDEFVKREEDSLSGKELLKNLKSQLEGIQEWRDNLDELVSRGVAEGLIEELQELGPSAAVEIESLTKLSDKKLAEYVETWEKLNAEIADIAETEMSDEKAELDKEIETIKDETNSKLIVLRGETQGLINEITLEYTKGLGELGIQTAQVSEEVGVGIIEAINIGVEETEESLMTKLNTLKEDVTRIVRSIKRQVALAESAGASIDGSHRNGLDYVPYDGYVAQLHQGERVLTKSENEKYNEGNIKTTGSQNINVNFTGTMGQLIRVLKPEIKLDDDRGGVEY